ncbi:MAG: rhodanese-like domain-containing protein [bacterium]|nr:rhodanese-like domain-containing protein [bacterium]
MAITFNTITKEQLKERLDRGERIQIVDIRPYSAYFKEHIPKALHLPYDLVEERATEVLNYEEPIVLYGSDEKDVFTQRAAEILVSRKFDTRSLYLLAEGFIGWRGGGYFTASE